MPPVSLLYAACVLGASAGSPRSLQTTAYEQWVKQYIQTASGAPGFRTTLGTGITLTIESNPRKEDAMQVERLQYDPVQNLVILKGHLAREVSQGNVSTEIKLGQAPSSLTAWERMTMKAGFALAMRQVGRANIESLCAHLGNQSCPLKAGKQEIRFRFRQLPRAVMVGEYILEANVSDGLGQHLISIKAHLDVPRRAKSEFKRLLWETKGNRLCSGGGKYPVCDICEGRGVIRSNMFLGENCGKVYDRYVNDKLYYEDQAGCASEQLKYANSGCCVASCAMRSLQGVTVSAAQRHGDVAGPLQTLLVAASLVAASVAVV